MVAAKSSIDTTSYPKRLTIELLALDPIVRKLFELDKEVQVTRLREVTDEISLDVECHQDAAREYH